MKETPIPANIVDNAIQALGITDFSNATIREIVAVAQQSERISGQEFIKMEMGVPALS